MVPIRWGTTENIRSWSMLELLAAEESLSDADSREFFPVLNKIVADELRRRGHKQSE